MAIRAHTATGNTTRRHRFDSAGTRRPTGRSRRRRSDTASGRRPVGVRGGTGILDRSASPRRPAPDTSRDRLSTGARPNRTRRRSRRCRPRPARTPPGDRVRRRHPCAVDRRRPARDRRRGAGGAGPGTRSAACRPPLGDAGGHRTEFLVRTRTDADDRGGAVRTRPDVPVRSRRAPPLGVDEQRRRPRPRPTGVDRARSGGGGRSGRCESGGTANRVA